MIKKKKQDVPFEQIFDELFGGKFLEGLFEAFGSNAQPAKKSRGQRGRAKATLDLIATCIEIIEQVQPITVRGVCYRLFVAGHITSMEKQNTQKISRLLTDLREEDEIPWEWIVDDSRQMEGEGGFKDLKAYARAIEDSYRRDFWAHQKNRVIVISEKATVAGIVRPVLDEYGVPFFAAHGFNSATKVHDLAEEMASDPRAYILLYVGDHDPSGMFMSVEDLPKRLSRYGADTLRFNLVRLALVDRTLNRQETDALPSFPAKKDDPRYRWYKERYGENAWELDAMNPNDLRERVRQAIEQCMNPEDWKQHQLVEEAQKEAVKKIADKMAETIS